jgi:subtilisin family serine protease
MKHVRRVRTTDRVVYEPTLDVSLPWIGVQDYWDEHGGALLAGRNVKVAVIDTGIDHTNPMFEPSVGMSYPPGFPKGAVGHTSEKVIAARAYFRPDDPVDTTRDEPNPMDHQGHGSHCAGIIAGSAGTTFDMGGYLAEVSGVAPQAYLMSYKVFYSSESGTRGAFEPELMAAFEDAVADGADVISNSWGGPDVFGPNDPSLAVYEAAIEAGCIVVFAAGNEGPGEGTISSPGIYGPFITVGAAATGRHFSKFVEVVAPEPVPQDLRGVVMSVGRISPGIHSDVGPAPLVSSHVVAPGNEGGCDPFGADLFAGSIALLLRGGCLFTEKIQNAADAGAIGVIVRNHLAGEGIFAMNGEDVSVPSVMVSYEDGYELRSWAEAHPDAEVALRSGRIPYEVTGEQGQVVAFSSRGPTAWARLKPDIVAPGTLILSADAHRVGSSSERVWGLKGGTSMAAPHVSGVAALLKQQNPEWAHREIKSAMVGTAVTEGLTSYTGMVSAGPVETGGGLVDLRRLLSVPLLVHPPVIDIGEVVPSGSATALVTVEAVDSQIGQVGLRWEVEEGGDGVTIAPPTGTVATVDASGKAEITISATAEAGSGVGDISGFLVFEDNVGFTTKAPFFVRVVPPHKEKDLLLVDLSFPIENEKESCLPVYQQAAEEAGVGFDVAVPTEVAGVPPLAELMRYRAILLSTGDDVANHRSGYGAWTLDRISSYLARGGGLIVAGQGPLRDSNHPRIQGMMAAATLDEYPLTDEQTDELVQLEEYEVTAIDYPQLITSEMFLNDTPATGDLKLVGELVQAVANGESAEECWARPVLDMSGTVFSGLGTVGMVYDPYAFYGIDPVAEAHRHRVVMLGFGLEVVEEPDGGGSLAPGSRAELLKRAFEWVSDRVTLDFWVARTDLDVTLFADAQATQTQIVGYTFDFGDGSEPVMSEQGSASHTYDRFGSFEVTVTATSESGAADIVRRRVAVQPGSEGVDASVEDASPGHDAGDGWDASTPDHLPSGGGCRCAASSSVVGGSSMPAWLVLLALLATLFFLGRQRGLVPRGRR